MNNSLSNEVAAMLPHLPQNARRLLLLGAESEGLALAFKSLNPTAYCAALRPMSAGKQATDGAINLWVNVDLDQGLSKLAVIKPQMDMLVVMADAWAWVKDPLRMLKELRRFMAKDAVCVVWAPNVAHWQRLELLLQGRTPPGPVFDSQQVRNLLGDAGWTLQSAGARQGNPKQNDQALAKWSGLASSLNLSVQQLGRSLLPKQWMVSAVNGPVHAGLYIAAVGLPPRVAGTNEARMQYPLNALKTLPGVRCVHGEGRLSIPPQFQPGILMLSRQFMNSPDMLSSLETKVREGWVLVADMDDDPLHWPEYQASDFLAFKGVHAVTVSTPELARRIAVWNPHVHVLPNAVHWIQTKLTAIPKQKPRVRVFFGALNRQPDWQAIMPGLVAAAVNLGDSIEFVVVHDQAFHDALPKTSVKSFHPTLSHAAYGELLASCDIALLPLLDNAFNRCKSDLKLIECAAAGVVPICASVVYADNPAHHSFAKFADAPAEWMAALIKLSKQTGELNRRAKLGYAYASSVRMHSQQVVVRRDLYLSLLADRDMLEAHRQQRLQAMQPGPVSAASPIENPAVSSQEAVA